MRYLLDTNIVSNMIRDPHGSVAMRVAKIGEQQICTSIIVAMELRFGAARRGSESLTTKIDTLLEKLDVLPLDAPVDRYYADLRTQLEKVGTLIGANDLLIASHTLALGYTLVTDNQREFVRVKSLKIENWLR